MRLKFLALLFAAALTAPVQAEPGMWRVHDADTEVILFGTIHELPVTAVWQTPRILEAFDAADTLVVEVDIPDDPFVVARAVETMGIQSGLPPIADRVPADRRAALLKAINEAKLPIAAVDRMRTWLAAITLSDRLVDAAGFDAESGADTLLMQRARATKKPIVGLETIEQQLGYFDTLTEADQRKLLLATLDDIGTARADAEKLVADWLAGNTDAIGANADKELRTTPELLARLVQQRNARWATWIEGVLKRPGKIFVAVGAGHLAGPDSVQTMLEAKGIKVERIP
ncbi:TraB/GumN family protein [Polymorphobacter arshaanensis]|uniref:TraB/GumN family protein n=1 Tax=Glacieibacterium arshaanense TaxID=2511025 RepID=A0A4Y9ENQ4_9SPHN|nr:TraB/GumN family protein [Polymorphobacter arshaanensis]TFU03677.1 TraB/GumN family protein [Polymorphobacter arshaanensis]